MLILSTTLLALLVPGLGNASAQATTPDRYTGRCCDLYPAASGELVVDVAGDNRGPTVEEIASQYADLTGQRLIYSDETAGMLAVQTCGLRGSVRVPADEVQSFFETLMISNDYLIQPLRPEEPRLVLIESLRTQARNTARGDAHWVPEEDLEHLARHPATLVATVIEMPNTDVRQLSNAMRTMIVDANTQQLLPAGDTDSLVLVGLGAQVRQMQTLLKRVDSASRTESPELTVIPLENADVNEVWRTLSLVMTPPSAGKGEGATSAPSPGSPRIVADPRTNSLIVMAKAVDVARIRTLVEHLDREG